MRRGPAACLLWPFSLLFRILVALRGSLYDRGLLVSERVAVPVIVVGNLFVGGTGKTPFTIWLVGALRRAGYVPGVVSRGHGARGDVTQSVTSSSRPQEVGDEPVLIVQRTLCPLTVGRDRPAAARALLAHHPEVDVIISDDGLQHYALSRDVEIVVSDARGNGNGWLLPAGPLREPASRQRDFTVVNDSQRSPGWPADAWQMRVGGTLAERLMDSAQAVSLASLADSQTAPQRRQKIVALAGIGNPDRFFGMLRDAGLTFDQIALPDHFDFTGFSFAHIAADLVLITEKDAVKCRHVDAIRDDPRVWVVPVSAQLDDALAQHIVEKLRGHPTT